MNAASAVISPFWPPSLPMGLLWKEMVHWGGVLSIPAMEREFLRSMAVSQNPGQLQAGWPQRTSSPAGHREQERALPV